MSIMRILNRKHMNMRGLNPGLQVLTSNSQSPASLTASTAATVIGANVNRNALQLVADSANTAVIYLKLGGTTASATVWDIEIPIGGSWNGQLSSSVWQGSVSAYCTAAAKLSVLEA